MNLWQKIKTVLYIIAGLLVIIFHEFCLNNVPYVVGTVMLAYGLEDIIYWIIKGFYKEESKFYEGLALVILSVIMIFLVRDNFTTCLVIWGVWSILREGKELNESIRCLIEKKPGIINLIESIVIIILSTTLIIEPVVHHAHVHIFLLGIELLLEVVFPIYTIIFERIKNRKIDNKEEVKD